MGGLHEEYMDAAAGGAELAGDSDRHRLVWNRPSALRGGVLHHQLDRAALRQHQPRGGDSRLGKKVSPPSHELHMNEFHSLGLESLLDARACWRFADGRRSWTSRGSFSGQ